MKKIVFYSWQSDLPNSTNRNFIQQALEKAVTNIVNDDTVAVEPVVDRDTKGVAGAPDIASTIFAKITSADVFVADISIIAHPQDGRPTPNPNVLIELGYALKSLGHERIILVFNNSFGEIAELPFDLRTRRLMTYTISSEEKNRAPEKLKLEKQLEDAIRSALDNVSEPENDPVAIPAVMAIENNQSNKIIILRNNLLNLLKKIDKFQQKKCSEGGTVDDLILSIDSTQELVAEFSKITETAIMMNDMDALLEIYKWFGYIIERYDYPRGKDGLINDADHDYFKFVGRELFITMIAFLIRENKLAIIKRLLVEPIPVKYLHYENGPGNVFWQDVSEYIYLLAAEGQKRNRLCFYADILDGRHSSGGLSAIMPMDEFVSADFFLFLLGELPKEKYEGPSFEWRPWSVPYMKHTPMFIKNAEQKQYAQQLVELFNTSNIEEFKIRLKERYPAIHQMFSGGILRFSIDEKDINKIGSR